MTSASGAKPASIAFALLLASVLLWPRVWATARQSSVPLFYLLAAVAAWIFSWGPFPEFLGTQVLYEAPFGWLMHCRAGIPYVFPRGSGWWRRCASSC